MGPKPKKSPSPSKSPQKKADKDVNDTSFLTASLNDENWKCMISFVVPSNAYEELYLEQIDKCVKTGQRKRFTWLSKKELVEFVNNFFKYFKY